MLLMTNHNGLLTALMDYIRGCKEMTDMVRALKITKFDKLERFIKKFERGHMNFVIVESRGGLGKTWLAVHTIKLCRVISGYTTALAFYKELFDFRHSIFVLDDIDELLKNKNIVAMMKQLCDSTKVRTVQYHSTTTILSGQGYPPQFPTSSPVILITNDLQAKNKNVKALLTRAHFIMFEPSSKEIIRYARTFFDEEEILDYAEEIVKKRVEAKLNLRTLTKARELKRSKINWKKLIEHECLGYTIIS